VLHELGHGLGFQTFTDEFSGLFFPYEFAPELQLPSIWDYFLHDPKQRKNWAQMTPEERVTSAITPRNLVWSGNEVTKNARKVLNHGTPEIFVAGKGLNKLYENGPAEFGPPIDERVLISTELARVIDQPKQLGLACTPLDATNAAAVQGKIALIESRHLSLHREGEERATGGREGRGHCSGCSCSRRTRPSAARRCRTTTRWHGPTC
ncbi:MAG TPA: hypothetical protein VLJ62_04605, partial [Burkholderiaceae bacterium]|nr:hypothetical protein [Burkholderiaceae bacterium]